MEDGGSTDVGIQAAQRRQVPRRQRLHCRRCRRFDRARADGARTARRRSPRTPSRSRRSIVVDPYTIRFKTATPYPLMPSDMTQVAIISKAAAKATTEDFNSGKAAIGTGPYRLVRYAKGDRIELARYDGYWGGKTPWEKVTLRMLAAGRVAGRGAAVGRRAGDRERPDHRCRAICATTSASPSTASSPTGSSTCTWTAIATCRRS